MTNSLELLGLTTGLAIAVSLFFMAPRRIRGIAVVAGFLVVTLSSFSQPSLAAAANDEVLTGNQRNLNETLKTAPQGNHYEGIEYSQVRGEPLSDREITERIRNEVSESLRLSVSNGSVRLSGRVADRRAAQQIVQNVKEIPGVHEISYDLGYSS